MLVLVSIDLSEVNESLHQASQNRHHDKHPLSKINPMVLRLSPLSHIETYGTWHCPIKHMVSFALCFNFTPHDSITYSMAHYYRYHEI